MENELNADLDTSPEKLVIGISSSALFDMSEGDRVFRQQGVADYAKYQRQREKQSLAPGDAFDLVKKLLALNQILSEQSRPQSVEVVLLSRNSADTGLRVFNSIQDHDLDITRAAFTSGYRPYRYMKAFACQLFLSTNADDVREVLNSGLAAASILPAQNRIAIQTDTDASLKFAFDGDAVLFSDEAERVYQSDGLAAFAASEQLAADRPLGGGPFKPFLRSLQQLQRQFEGERCPIRTALVTARSAPAHERVIKTLRQWDVRLDEYLFLGGLAKREFLKTYGADVFFDDQANHCLPASEVVATGHVLHGISNES